MKYLNATMIAMMDIKQFKKDLGLEHEQTKISKDWFDTTFVSASHLNTKENRRLNRLAIEEFNNQESRD
jgi:hypothetical protein